MLIMDRKPFFSSSSFSAAFRTVSLGWNKEHKMSFCRLLKRSVCDGCEGAFSFSNKKKGKNNNSIPEEAVGIEGRKYNGVMQSNIKYAGPALMSLIMVNIDIRERAMT